MSNPATPAAFIISDTRPDGPVYNLSIFHFMSNCISLKRSISTPCKLCVQKLLMIKFFFADSQHTIIIFYGLLTNNTLISFNHLITILNTSTLIIPLHSISRSFPFYFTFCLVNSPPILFLHF